MVKRIRTNGVKRAPGHFKLTQCVTFLKMSSVSYFFFFEMPCVEIEGHLAFNFYFILFIFYFLNGHQVFGLGGPFSPIIFLMAVWPL
jgi:hypothetical protein